MPEGAPVGAPFGYYGQALRRSGRRKAANAGFFTNALTFHAQVL
jgi:hypothetical protein